MLEKILSFIGIDNNSSSGKSAQSRSVEPTTVVRKIRHQEQLRDIPQGKKIHGFDYLEYSISVDCEFTGQYRISVFIGNHKVYGFIINDKDISDEHFTDAIEQILDFLSNEPSVQTLPDSNRFQSHFFGNP